MYTRKMLIGALLEYCRGNPEYLSVVDIGLVIDISAKSNIEDHIQIMLKKCFKVYQPLHDNLPDSKE
ncbi:hypothetical protein [Candidatus Ishikawella capsulata]|uniref:hypothetical protein n=1 Tax=Candidatus Ishikawella capsulata TaxID=168169 RepID=UPI00130D90B4|nr:hypothetical protein [Candidatus Ishikawaella capsulata]